MHTTVTSADGTPIACDVVGSGIPVVLVAGMFCTRHTLAPLAAALADAGCRAATYDRRGRGDSGGAGPVPPPDEAVAREVEDLRAVMAWLGDDVAVYGHSSGACVAFREAAGGVGIGRLVLHEPPWSDDDPVGSVALGETILTALAEERPGDAITAFMGGTGMPPEAVAAIAADPAMLAVAPTMPYDLAATGADGSVPVSQLSELAAPTLVLAGTASPPFFLRTAEQVADRIPDARLTRLEGADHGAPADVVAPPVATFLGA